MSPAWNFVLRELRSCSAFCDRIVGFQASIATLSTIEVSSIASVEIRGVEKTDNDTTTPRR